MINESTESPILSALNAMVQEHNWWRLQTELARKKIGGFSLYREDFQTVKIQLRALAGCGKTRVE
jgi:hypothetical protein